MRDGDLGRFIRSRREATSPTALGLPVGERRRTPGLRRAELATLAGISVDYLIRIEQGRDRHPSAQVLAAVAAALQLDDDDMHDLRTLAAINATPELCPGYTPVPVRYAEVLGLLHRLEPAPALVLNHLSDVLAWTETFERIAGPLGMLADDRPNLMRFTFGDPRAKRAFPQWALVADAQVANLTRSWPPEHPDVGQLVAELTELGGAAFSERYANQTLRPKRGGITLFAHPDVGDLRVQFETLTLDDDELRIVVYLPDDEVTAERFDELAGCQPGSLRALNAG